MLFKSAEEVTPCGMLSIEHFVLLAITTICIIVALKHTKKIEKEKVKKIIQKMTIFLWILEIIKIVFNIKNYGAYDVNKYVPLYFCSLILYAGIFSGFCKGFLKRTGDVFLATGGIIAGIIYLITPLTSLTIYPALHYITIQSFILHGIMVYIGMLMLITEYTVIEKKNLIYYSSLLIIISIIAYIVNLKFNSNLMFVSQNYPGTYIEIIYNITGKLFPVVMIAAQATLPFLIVYEIYKVVIKKKDETNKTNKNIGSKENKKEELEETKEEIYN